MQPVTVYPNQVQVQPATVVQTVPTATNDFSSYKSASICLGATQVTIGILAVIFQIVTILAPIPTPAHIVGTGIWTGTFFIITGAMGIASSKNKNKGWAIAFLVLNLVSIFLAMVLFITSSVSLPIHYHYRCDRYTYEYDEYGNYRRTTLSSYYSCMEQLKVGIAAESILIFLGFLEFIIAIISSGFGCGRLCCYSTTPRQVIYQGQTGTVIVQGPAAGYQPQQIANVQGQGYPNQPPAYQMYPSQGQGQPMLHQNQPTQHVPLPMTQVTPSAPQGQLKQSEDHVYQGLEKDLK